MRPHSSTTVAPLPQERSRPSVSPSRPFSWHSMAKAMTAPAEIVSTPRRLQTSLAAAMDSRSSFRHSEPKAAAVSYSGPAPSTPA